MESKKINQLATSVSPQTSDLTIIGDPVTGVSKKITLLQIANLFATTGTVSSVAVTETGDALTITGSPITTAGTINIGFAGDATQYVRGDGALADFPTSTGGGSSVSYYLNSSVSQGTIGGVAYRQLSKTPIAGAGTDITISANGYIASYITDANDPALLEVPGGNFNCEFYFSVNSNAHNAYIYAELYKYDGTTFTLLGSSQSVPEYLTNGTTLSPYYFAIPVATAALTVTDRLAVRIFVNVDTKTVTLHTENNHLCQVVTTFSKGLTSLNNLTRQVQFLATGTSGTDFNISSSTATHTFNIPDASASNRGLITTGTQTIAGAKTFSSGVISSSFYAQGNGTQGGYLYLKQGTTPYSTLTGSNSITADGTKYIFFSDAGSSNGKIALFELGSLTNNTNRTYTFPDASGTLALTSDISYPVTSVFGRTGAVVATEGDYSLTQLSDVTITTPTNGQVLKYNGTAWVNDTDANTGTVTSVAALTIGTSGTDLSSSVANSTTTPVITLNVPTASATNRGALSSTDWTTFNNKYNLPSLTSGSVLFSNGSTIAQDNANFFWDDTNNRLGIGTSTPNAKLQVGGFDNANALVIAADPSSPSSLYFGDGTGAALNRGFVEYAHESDTMTIGTSATTRLTIASTGAATFSSSVNVGGTTITDGHLLNIVGSSATSNIGIVLNKTNSTAQIWGITNVGALTFYDYTASTERMRITSGGSVNIATSNPGSRALSVGGEFSIGSNSSNTYELIAFINSSYARIGPTYQSGGSYVPLTFWTSDAERMRITSAGNTQPGTDNAYSLGVSGTRWSAVWAANGTIQTSDEREKKDIIDADLGLDFISKLRPVSFKWKVGQNIVTSEVVKDEEGNPILDEEGNEKTESVIVPREGKRTHYGLIAQEVEELLDGKDFGGFIHDEETDTKGLRYDQFVPLLIKSIQELEAKIVTLESKLN